MVAHCSWEQWTLPLCSNVILSQIITGWITNSPVILGTLLLIEKKNWCPAPARTLQDGIKENSTLHLYRTASYSNSLIFFTGYKCKKGKIISSFIIKYSLWCVNLLISEILKSVCVFPENVTRLKRSVSKQATEQSWSKYFLNFIAFLSFKTS